MAFVGHVQLLHMQRVASEFQSNATRALGFRIIGFGAFIRKFLYNLRLRVGWLVSRPPTFGRPVLRLVRITSTTSSPGIRTLLYRVTAL